jgi:formate dehydrogenase major subunit
METADTLRAVIDGATLELAAGSTVLQALQRQGQSLPTFCHDARLSPAGLCWSCAVEVAAGPGQPFVVRPACREPLRDGSLVRSSSPALDAFRHGLIERLAVRVAPADLERFPDKPLHAELCRQGIAAGAAGFDADGAASTIDRSHPCIRVDMSRCIACRRCVRICAELQGESVWHVFGRGADLRIGSEGDLPLAQSRCVGCGACADSCPTAALTDAAAWTLPPPTRWTRTTCAYCGVGCEIEVGVAGERIVATRPVVDSPTSKGHLCIKGRYANGYVDAADRVLQPLLRHNGGWQAASWDDAIGHAAQGLQRIIAAHGPDAVGVLGSARATNEENFLIQKFARLAIGSNNVDCCARVCHAPSAQALKAMLGTGAATNSYDDIERAAGFLVVGANPLENHPVVGARIRQQVLRGARLVVIDPRRTGLAAIADVHLALRPGTNLPLLNALAQVICSEGLLDRDFVAARVDGLAAFEASVGGWTPERAGAICGVDAEAIRRAARLYATTPPAMCFHGLGVTEHQQGGEGVMALVNLALLTGNLGRPGSGVNPLRGQNNVQGAAVMGCEPGALTGSAPLADAAPRFASAWGAVVPDRPGLGVTGMLDAARAGRLKALYVVGFDLLASLANRRATAEALARLERVIVQDLFLTDTAQAVGHVFLPAVSSFEKDGTFMSSERRIQRVRRAVAPRGDALDDAAIICRLAAAMGHGAHFASSSAETVWNEVRSLWPAVAGISYARIERQGLQWPCRDADDPGMATLHATAFAGRPRATLACIDYRPSTERTDAEYPLLLSTGRVLQQFNVGTMSGRSAQQPLRPTDTLDMHPADARALAFVDGESVRVQSRHGEACLPLRITDTVQPGQLFATFHDPARRVNCLTGSIRDGASGTPEYKVTAVRVLPA